ncbi:hypothetical protein E2C01_060031 [Portunus trituberculatus]|uniref:Uncharacterized protein n=1 Tax=Portunus trituberculatus TaxID=210409 RepID=A0A5B7H703_PORTR|nr:hypothetical protein [Portunus trituberculatus]
MWLLSGAATMRKCGASTGTRGVKRIVMNFSTSWPQLGSIHRQVANLTTSDESPQEVEAVDHSQHLLPPQGESFHPRQGNTKKKVHEIFLKL